MAYNYNKLAGRIVEICGTRAEFAKKMGLSERMTSLKLNNKSSWTQRNIQKAIAILDIDPKDIGVYFFTVKN